LFQCAFAVPREVSVYQFEDVLCRVDVLRHLITDRIEIIRDVGGRTIVDGFSCGEQEKLVKKTKGRCGRLVNARDNDDLQFCQQQIITKFLLGGGETSDLV
jgi:hypothetical protein